MKYKRVNDNTQTDSLYGLHAMREKTPRGDSDAIPAFLLDDTNLELKRNLYSDEIDFIEVAYAEEDKRFTKMDASTPPASIFQPVRSVWRNY